MPFNMANLDSQSTQNFVLHKNDFLFSLQCLIMEEESTLLLSKETLPSANPPPMKNSFDDKNDVKTANVSREKNELRVETEKTRYIEKPTSVTPRERGEENKKKKSPDKRFFMNDQQRDFNNTSMSLRSVRSGTSSIFSSFAFPFAFQRVSRHIFPSDTEVILEEDNNLNLNQGVDCGENDDDLDFDKSEQENDIQCGDEVLDYSISSSISGDLTDNPFSPIALKSSKTPLKQSRRSASTKMYDAIPPLVSQMKVGGGQGKYVRLKRTIRRRIFLLLTEPESSIFSAVFFMILITTIALSNIVMMMQTMDYFNFSIPNNDNCDECLQFYASSSTGGGGGIEVPCQCPPEPIPQIVYAENMMIYFFTIEWTLRVLCFQPSSLERHIFASEQMPSTRMEEIFLVDLRLWFTYLFSSGTVLDALAIFPYYLERYEKANGFLSFRLMRLFRVFQLLRLGQYNVTFVSLTNVLSQSLLSLNILIIVVFFGAAFFGSIIYWLEKGEWMYNEEIGSNGVAGRFMYMRRTVDGNDFEPSPFVSIPACFWWFIVTTTTVGYGDFYPTSTWGKIVGANAMLMGVLVIAFPVSVFSDLWSKELKKTGIVYDSDLESEDSNDVDGTHRFSSEREKRQKMMEEATSSYRSPSTSDSIRKNDSISSSISKNNKSFVAQLGFRDPIREYLIAHGKTSGLPEPSPLSSSMDSRTKHFKYYDESPKNTNLITKTPKIANIKSFSPPKPVQTEQQKTVNNQFLISSEDHAALLQYMKTIDSCQEEIRKILLKQN